MTKNYDKKLWQKTSFQAQILVLFSYLILFHVHRPQKFKNGVIFALGPTVLLIKPVFRFCYQNAMICTSKWSGWNREYIKALFDQFLTNFCPILSNFGLLWHLMAQFWPNLDNFDQMLSFVCHFLTILFSKMSKTSSLILALKHQIWLALLAKNLI